MTDTAFLAVDSIDPQAREVTFVLGDDGGLPFAKAKPATAALKGGDVFAQGKDHRVGKVVSVESRDALRRSFVTVRLNDEVTWLHAKHGVFKGAQAKVYGDGLGSLNLVDRPHEDATVLKKAAAVKADPVKAVEAALSKAKRGSANIAAPVASGWTAAADPLAQVDAALAKVRRQLDLAPGETFSERLAKVRADIAALDPKLAELRRRLEAVEATSTAAAELGWRANLHRFQPPYSEGGRA